MNVGVEHRCDGHTDPTPLRVEPTFSFWAAQPWPTLSLARDRSRLARRLSVRSASRKQARTQPLPTRSDVVPSRHAELDWRDARSRLRDIEERKRKGGLCAWAVIPSGTP